MKNVAFNRDDFVSGMVVFAVSLLLYFVVIPDQVGEGPPGPMALSPALFPRVATLFIAGLSVLLMLRSIRISPDSGEEKKKLSLREKGRIAVAVTGCVLYAWLIQVLGFYSSTALFLVGTVLFFEPSRWKQSIFTVAIVSAFVYLVFNLALKVHLPDGLIG